jgi:hypothetical protein
MECITLTATFSLFPMHVSGVEVRVVIMKNQRLDLPGKRKIFRFHIRRSYLFSPLSDGIGPGLKIHTATHTLL